MTFEGFFAAVQRRERAASNDRAKDLICARADLGTRWSAVSRILATNGEWTDAISAAKLGVSQSSHPSMLYALMTCYLDAGRPHDAIRACSHKDQIYDAAFEHVLGICYQQLGDFDAALFHFERALKRNPINGAGWLALATLSQDDDEAISILHGRVKDLLRQGTLPEAQMPPIYHALGQIQDRMGDVDSAFHSFSTAANLASRTVSYDALGDVAEAKELLKFDRRSFAEGSDHPSEYQTIFVSGLPRSGTTIVEQILACHPAITGGSETEIGKVLTRELGRRDVVGLRDYTTKHGSLKTLSDLHRHLRTERFGPGRVVDKSLNLSRFAGVYRAVLGDVPMIWLDRDPLDTAWSNYRTWFANGAGWSLSLKGMAHHFALEERLADHWQEILGTRFLRIDYARLVSAPEETISAIARHCGLEMLPAMLAPHMADRAVTSASYTQVRKPLNRAGIGTSARYDEYLVPFVEALHVARKTVKPIN